MQVSLNSTPSNLVAAADPALENGTPYLVQNLSDYRVFGAVAATQPGNDVYTFVLDPLGGRNPTARIEIDTDEPPWLWCDGVAIVGVTETS